MTRLSVKCAGTPKGWSWLSAIYNTPQYLNLLLRTHRFEFSRATAIALITFALRETAGAHVAQLRSISHLAETAAINAPRA